MKTKKSLGSFRKKISISFVLLTAVFILLTAVAASAAVFQVYRVQTGERIAFELGQLRDTLDGVTTGLNDCTNRLIMQLNADRRLSLPELARQEQADRTSTEYILPIVTSNLRLAPDASSINILLDSGILYAMEYNKPTVSMRADDALRETISRLPITPKGGFYRVDDGPDALLYYGKELRDIRTSARVGIVYLTVPPGALHRYCVSAQDSSIVVTDASGGVIVTTGSLAPGEHFPVPPGPTGRLHRENASWLYETGAVARTGWQVTCLLNESLALAPIRRAILWLTVSALGVLAVMTCITIAIAGRIARPIGALSAHMVGSADNLPLPLAVPNEADKSDEIAALYASFNSMLRQNRQLFDDYKAEQQQKNRTELALMQSQIKPHFLYNTLDTIYCLAGMGRAEEAGVVTKALADYYRLVLNHGEEKITVERELEALRRYLSIMQVRYRDMLTTTIGCEDSVKNVIVPKLLLQPLVENAIYHGIKPKMAHGAIEIYAARVGDTVELTVTDDGVGMTPERFAQALAGVHHADDSETFGMHNIVRRLQLFYGESSRLELRRSNGRTTIAVILDPREARDV